MTTLIKSRNVHEALVEGCRKMRYAPIRDSRNGLVKQLTGVLVTSYDQPDERVIFHAERDANPFFHFFESLWMLSGQKDVAFPNQFCSGRMSAFSDDGKTLNGAYGWRWRTQFGFDQLVEIVENLKRNRDCRRQVLSMWESQDLLNRQSKDVPCNLSATFQISNDALDMTVFNRSNDLIWGAYGANAVHFSYLQEWVARMVGVFVGTYTQVSANTHVYKPHWPLVEVLADKAPDVLSGERPESPYHSRQVFRHPLIVVGENMSQWNSDLEGFFRFGYRSEGDFLTQFFKRVVLPMWGAHDLFRDRDVPKSERIGQSLDEIQLCAASDWRLACKEWLERRDEA